MAHHQAPQKNQAESAHQEDGSADAFAAVAVIAVVVAAVCFWLNGMA